MAEMNFNFQGKKAVVTGGTKGIGLAIVAALAKANIDKIYVIGRSQTALESVKSDFSCVETVRVDLEIWDEARQALQTIEPVNFLINNAGTNVPQSFFETTHENLDLILNLNVKSVINVSQIVCKKMIEIGGGVVVNVSSQASMKAVPKHVAYTASKAALDAVTRQMAFELAPQIRVNAVNPTVVMTELGRAMWGGEEGDKMKKAIPLGRFAELEDVSGTVLYLLSDCSAMVNGLCLPVCGGYTNV